MGFVMASTLLDVEADVADDKSVMLLSELGVLALIEIDDEDSCYEPVRRQFQSRGCLVCYPSRKRCPYNCPYAYRLGSKGQNGEEDEERS